MLSTNRRTKLVLPTAVVPNMQIFFCSMGAESLVILIWLCRRYAQRDAAVELVVTRRVAASHWLRCADSVRLKVSARYARFDQLARREFGALLAERHIQAFGAGGVGVADDFDGQALAGRRCFRE